MANNQIKTCKRKQHIQKESNKKIQYRTKNQTRTRKRRIRRRRNKFKYYQYLRKQRTFRRTQDLCAAVKIFDITEMEWSSESKNISTELPNEVLEWQKRDQMAYWKSKALSLELENKMLREHIRYVYAQTIQNYSSYKKSKQEFFKNPRDENNIDACGTDEVKPRKTDNCETITPNFPELKNRSNELKKMYGDKAPKILGMETAVQLNYERHLEKSKACYWPHIPLNC